MDDEEWKTETAGIPVKGKEITSANILGVSAGTTAPAGGDAGHGGRTLIRIEDLGGTNWGIRITGNQGEFYTLGGPMDLQLGSVEILLGGDTEAETIAEALEFAAETIRRALGN